MVIVKDKQRGAVRVSHLQWDIHERRKPLHHNYLILTVHSNQCDDTDIDTLQCVTSSIATS